jgi:ribonuclease Y
MPQLDLVGLAFAVVLSLVTLFVGLAIGYLVTRYLTKTQVQSAALETERALAEANAQSKEILLAAKGEALKLREALEGEEKEHRAEQQRQERRLQQRNENLDQRIEAYERRERKLSATERELEEARKQADTLKQEQLRELERLSHLSQDDAKTLLLERVESEVRQDAARVIREVEMETREEANKKAREIISLAIQRLASEEVAETTVSVVPLPSDDMKGRIIGREGRNIRILEKATGVDFIVDDTPEAVILSAFDPVRREIARVALTRLMADGRIHPARIEDVVNKAREEVEVIIREAGEQTAYTLGVRGLPADLIKLLGRLRYRTSYGQNVLQHSIEVSRLASMMASEIGADVNICKIGGLLHDIGKAVDHEVDGPHALIGADLAKRFGRSPAIIHTIAAHHAEEEPQTVEAVLVQAADAISGARPGARRETLESYIKRLEALENVANSFQGVEKSYAIQAGREVRIIVKPEAIDDLTAVRLARDVVKKIEESLDYPGQIKVTVIRETRAVDYAK